MSKNNQNFNILKSLVRVLGASCLIASFTAYPAYSQTNSQNKPTVNSQYRIIPSTTPSIRTTPNYGTGYRFGATPNYGTGYRFGATPNYGSFGYTGNRFSTIPNYGVFGSTGYRFRARSNSGIFGSTSEINNIGGDVTYPYGSRFYHNGVVQTPSGQLISPAVSTDHGNGSKTFYYPDGSRIDTNGSKIPSTGVLIK
jgi:hypothetical protein